MTNSSEELSFDTLDEEIELESKTIIADAGQEALRIDKFLSDRLPNISRNRIQNSTKAGCVLVNGNQVKPNFKIKAHDEITLFLPKKEKEEQNLKPEPVPLNIVYEDDHLLVINKQAGLVCHPGHGNKSGTLVNGLLFHLQNLPVKDQSDRPGIVHRLDKLTTGIMVIAKSDLAMSHLAKQFFDRSSDRLYHALIWGEPEESEGIIEGHIGRSLKDRKVMSVYPDGSFGKPAKTRYRVLEKFGYVTLIECKLETGRTHQIRAHFKHIGHPLFGDETYGGDRILKGTTFNKYKQFVQNCFSLLPRQALHAKTLSFDHPETGERMSFESELPDDMLAVLKKWRTYVSNRD